MLQTKPLSRVVECDICLNVEVTKQAELPDYWVMLWDYPHILCENCIDTWTAKWGEPAIWLRGGEDLL